MKIFRPTDFVMIGSWILAFILSVPWIEPLPLSRLVAVLCMGVFTVTAIGRELAGPGLPLPRSPIVWCLPLLCLLALASIIWSPAPMVSFVAFAGLIFLAPGFLAFTGGRGIFRVLVPLAPLTFLVLAVLALCAIAQNLFFPNALINGQVRWPFANPNGYAALLMLGLFPALGWYLTAAHKKASISALVVSMLLMAGIATIQGRAVFGLTVIGFIALAWACRGRAVTRWKGLALVALAGVAVLALQYVPIGGVERIAPLTHRAGELLDPENPTTQARLAIWRATLAMIQDHFWLGTGYGTFYLYYPQYRLAQDASSSGFMAHNDLLQLWAEMGVAAPLLLLAFYAGAAWRMIRVLRMRDAASGERAICFALFLGAGLVALDAMVNFDLYTAAILCLLGLVLGLWFRYSALVLGDATVTVRLPGAMPAGAGWCILALPLILFAFLAQGFFRSEYHADRAQQAVLDNRWDDFDKQANLARDVSFDRNARPYLMGAAVPVGILQTSAEKLSDAVKAQLSKQADILLRKTEERNARLSETYYYRAILSQSGLDDKRDARSWLLQALKINPGHIQARMTLADMAYQDGDKSKAIDILAEGLDRPPIGVNPESYYAMAASIALQEGRSDVREKALNCLARWKAAEAARKPAVTAEETVPPTPLR